MVGGLGKFREAFANFFDNFVIIGGTACEEIPKYFNLYACEGPQKVRSFARYSKNNYFCGRETWLISYSRD